MGVGMQMKHKFTKVTVCAVAAAMVISGSGLDVMAAGAKATLPAAGLGLTLGDGSSIADVREDVKQRKEEEKKSEKETQETSSASERETQTAYTERETQTVSASSERETQTVSAQETESQTQTAEESEEETRQESEIVQAVEPVLRQADQEASEEEQEQEETLIIAQVNNYVNIRSIPSTDGEIVGKLYNNSVGVLLSVEDDWYYMKSGNVEGYVKAEYFEKGEQARRIADEVGDRIATVNTQTLKVRADASMEASVLGLVPGGEELTVLDEENGFVKVSIEEGDGWVSMEYVDLRTEYVTAESVEEERARLEKEERAKEEAKKAADAARRKLQEEERRKEEERRAKEEAAAGAADAAAPAEEPALEPAAPVVSSDASLGAAVANYAVQFKGNPYVYGGTSLTNGADCSGFVMSVYKNFGVSLPHSSSADRSVGYGVGSLAEAQPGDIICYSGHVGIYIGNGQIIHASTEKTGIKISNASYRKILAIRRIF